MSIDFHDRTKTLGASRPPHPEHLTERTLKERTTEQAGLTGHWTGDGGTLFHPDPFIRLRGIYDYHVNTLGYGDIAYAGAFDADLNAFGLRDNRWVQAHAASFQNIANVHTNGIVFLEDSRGWTRNCEVAWQWWQDVFTLTLHKRPLLFAHEWWRHVGGTPTACPGAAFTHSIAAHGGKT